VPNFGADHDIVSTQENIRKAGGSLSLSQSVPACNSHTHPKCKDADTAAPEHLTPLWYSGLSQKDSIPACNSSTYPGCLDPKEAKTTGPKGMKPTWHTDDWGRPDLNESLTGASGLTTLN
jgi:hypothetical protein